MPSLKLFICGDFRAANPSIISFSEELSRIIENSNIRVCNFEAPVKNSGKAIKKSGPVLEQSMDSPSLLKKQGFNVILLANNHIMDFGKEGCEATLQAFNDVVTVGAGSAKDAFEIKVLACSGKTIGFQSLVQYEFGVVESREQKDAYGTAWINSLDIQDIIREGKSKVDYLFVFPHAGIEEIDAPLPEWRILYKKFIDWGADGVIASHPHTPQGWEVYKEKPIYYSLGNFYFDEKTGGEFWRKSLAVEIELSKTIETRVYNLQFENGLISIDNSKETKLHNEYINDLLHNHEKYESYIEATSKSLYKRYRYYIFRGLCGVSPKVGLKHFIRLGVHMLLNNSDEATMLNSFRCESHRWVIERYLKSKNRFY